MSIIMQYIDRFHDMLDKHADTRTTNWLLMSSPFPTLFICLTYVFVVKVLGPKLMENRKPFQLRNSLIIYNLFQVVFSSWLFYEGSSSSRAEACGRGRSRGDAQSTSNEEKLALPSSSRVERLACAAPSHPILFFVCSEFNQPDTTPE